MASGIEVKSDKSQVLFFNTTITTQRKIIQILGFSKGSLPSKYMGAPLTEGTIKKVSLPDFLDKPRSRLDNWTLRPLHIPSHLILVKAILQAMSVYLFSMLLAPKVVIKEIRGIQIIFLWGGRE